ncbi:MAG: DUF1822 family protein, partial [Spirulinaceae cyanobacterium SM2_1_0]|nr:DUF1822 family protein [Spirulinaceae cyanobacterium SM2_1_0]
GIARLSEPAAPGAADGLVAGKVAAGWQQLEDLALPAHELALNFRSGAVAKRPSGNFTAAKPRWIRRGKVLELSRATEQLALIVSIAPTASDEYDVGVDLCPVPPMRNLPADLKVQILDAKSQVVMQASARGTPAMSLEFSGTAGEDFSVRIDLGGVAATEVFAI